MQNKPSVQELKILQESAEKYSVYLSNREFSLSGAEFSVPSYSKNGLNIKKDWPSIEIPTIAVMTKKPDQPQSQVPTVTNQVFGKSGLVQLYFYSKQEVEKFCQLMYEEGNICNQYNTGPKAFVSDPQQGNFVRVTDKELDKIKPLLNGRHIKSLSSSVKKKY